MVVVSSTAAGPTTSSGSKSKPGRLFGFKSAQRQELIEVHLVFSFATIAAIEEPIAATVSEQGG